MTALRTLFSIIFIFTLAKVGFSQFYVSDGINIHHYDESTDSITLLHPSSTIYSYTIDYENDILLVYSNNAVLPIQWDGKIDFTTRNFSAPHFRSEIELIYDNENQFIYGSSLFSQLIRYDIVNDEEFVIATGNFGGLAIDFELDKIFWTDKNANKIMKSNLNGSNVEEVYYLPSGLSELDDIELDSENQIIYWTNKGQGRIQSCQYDGSDFQNIATSLTTPQSLVLYNNELFWLDNENNQILKHNLSTNTTVSLTDEFQGGINLQMNLETENLFWIHRNSFFKMSIAQKEIKSIYSSIYEMFNNMGSLNIDPIREKLIFSGGEKLIESNYDGSYSSSIENDNIYFSDYNTSFAIDPISERYFYSDSGILYSRHYNETEWSEIIVGGTEYHEIQVDITNKKLYYSNQNKIYRMNYDGSENELIFDSQSNSNQHPPYYIDQLNGKIYYSIGGFIRKANLDGTQQESIIAGNAKQIISDQINNRLYYIKGSSLYHSDLEGYFETLLSDNFGADFFHCININSFNLLPLIIVEANATGSDVTIEWTMDENFSGFVNNSVAIGNFFIERKTMTEDWTDIGTLSYFEGVSTYSYTDDAPEFGLNSYRLRYISDNGGLTSYSKNFEVDYLVGVETELPDDIKLWYAHLDKEIKTEGFTGQLNIYNQLGQLQLSQEVNTDISQHNVLHLEPGIHFMEIITNKGNRYAKSFIVIK